MTTLLQILKELLLMVWDIFWPLALGFILSAVIRAFVPMKTVSNHLGKNDAKSLGWASLFGALSSSCSYAAASMSRTLLTKGSTWSNAIAFMIASTNLVFEIFLVIVTLLGWAFFGGEIFGGILLILIGALLIKWLFSNSDMEKAKTHMKTTEAAVAKKDPHAHHAHMSMDENKEDHGHQHERHNHQHKEEKPTINAQKWKEAAGYFFMDVQMVGKDILIGVVVASILAVVVPQHFWETLFLKNNTALPQFIIILWNAIIGIIVALLAFVCSVGNILLAAVLWHSGINFGGVLTFILADLITLPMLLVYRRYYGGRVMWRLLLILSISILITGIGVDYLFQWIGWIPKAHGAQVNMQMDAIQWNYKTFLNMLFIPLSFIGFFLGKKWMHKKM